LTRGETKDHVDTECVAEIEIRRLQHAAQAHVCARMMASSEPWITLQRDFEASLEIIGDPAREVYVAAVNGEVTGFVILLMQGAFVGYIQSVCVAPPWRGCGIGSQLMAFAEGRIFSETPNCFICVSSFNQGARKFYERLGYVVVGGLKDYIIPGHSEILLRKTIGPLTAFERRPAAPASTAAAGQDIQRGRR
jgi:ribosomal protein S18 acetylase RimI-like enzyme